MNELYAFQSCCPTEAVSWITAPSRRLFLVSSDKKKKTNKNHHQNLFSLPDFSAWNLIFYTLKCETHADLVEKKKKNTKNPTEQTWLLQHWAFVKSKHGSKKSAPEELSVPVGTGTSGTVTRGSIPCRSQGQKSGGRGLMLASEVHKQPGVRSGNGSRARDLASYAVSCSASREVGRYCPGAAWQQGPHGALRIAVVWCLARWSQYLPCTAVPVFRYFLFLFPTHT